MAKMSAAQRQMMMRTRRAQAAKKTAKRAQNNPKAQASRSASLKGNQNAKGPHKVNPQARTRMSEGGTKGGQAHRGMHYNQGNQNAAGPHKVSRQSRMRMAEGGSKGGSSNRSTMRAQNSGTARTNNKSRANRSSKPAGQRSASSRQSAMNGLRNRFSLKKVA